MIILVSQIPSRHLKKNVCLRERNSEDRTEIADLELFRPWREWHFLARKMIEKINLIIRTVAQ